jgi:hypothetical protein
MSKLLQTIGILIILLFGLLLGNHISNYVHCLPIAERVNWSPSAQWIGPQSPNYRFYLRTNFYIPGDVQTAWLRLSADNDFRLFVNGKELLRDTSVLNNSLGVGARISDRFQSINDSQRYQSRTGVNYLLGNTRDWKITTYVDFAQLLEQGKNTIAVEVQKGRTNPKIAIEGQVTQDDGNSLINLSTGSAEWLVSSQFENQGKLIWTAKDYSDANWPHAQLLGPISQSTYSRMSPNLYTHPLEGYWITGSETDDGQTYLTKEWTLFQKPERAFLRFAGDGEYDILVNGHIIAPRGSWTKRNLRMYEVTQLLQVGSNSIAVKLGRSFDRDWLPIRQGMLTPLGSLNFFLDGWAEASHHKIVSNISTDSSWLTGTAIPQDWYKSSVHLDRQVDVVSAVDPQSFYRRFRGNSYLFNYPFFLFRTLWSETLGLVSTFALAWILGRFWVHANSFKSQLILGGFQLFPSCLFLLLVTLLQHRFAEEEQALIFNRPESLLWISLGIVASITLGLLSSYPRAACKADFGSLILLLLLITAGFISSQIIHHHDYQGSLLSSWLSLVILLFIVSVSAKIYLNRNSRLALITQAYLQQVKDKLLPQLPWITLTLVVIVSLFLRVYNIGFTALDSDENTSYDAIRGILRTGVPEVTSHIWYTRGPFFHYLTAFWLSLVGDTPVNARLFMAIWGAATVLMAFFLAREITGKIWLSILIAALLAIDPSILWYSRFIRFYQVVQFLCLLSLFAFIKGFIRSKGSSYQLTFFASLTLLLLCQEVNITLVPCYLLGFLIFYRPFRIRMSWPLLTSSILCLTIFAYNIIFFSIKCLTPWVALSSSTDAYLKPQLNDLTGFLSLFFVGPSRTHIIYSIFFFIGLFLFIKRREPLTVFLFFTVLINLSLLTVLVYQTASRYTYAIHPLFIILSFYSAYTLFQSLTNLFRSVTPNYLPYRLILAGSILFLLLSNLEPDRVFAGYKDAIARRNPSVFEYIREHQRPGDIVIANLPATAAIILGKLDYYLPPGFVIGFDRVYIRDGQLIDRWAGGTALVNLDQLSNVLAKAHRVWIQFDDRRAPRNASAPEIRRFYDFIDTLGHVEYDTLGVRLRLWDRDSGMLPREPNRGQDVGVF